MSLIVNIAAYKFVTLDNLPERKESLLELCRDLKLKGTILLSAEGINLFVAGIRESIDQLLDALRSQPEFADLPVKESMSDYQPFSRMLVRLKKEIIAFGIDDIEPAQKTSAKISPAELKKWLDENREIMLLDVRNDYEVEVGTFKNATPIGVDHFRHFPDAIENLGQETKTRPVVMFCTGGIRCEKAGPLLENKGYSHVYQLDGGILKYFEDVGGDHYDGDCFVFDKRVALRPNLEESSTSQCYACQAILSVDDQQSEMYLPGEYCPCCYKGHDELMSAQIESRHQKLQELTQRLPGSEPYDNIRPLRVGLRHDGWKFVDYLADVLPQIPKREWADKANAGLLRWNDKPLALDSVLHSGQRIHHHIPATVEPDVNADIQILHEDEAIIVVNKPAPLPMHPSGRFNRNTLIHILQQVYPGQPLRPQHRLDANTTGLVIIGRKKKFASKIQPLFLTGDVKKSYLAKVSGVVQEDQLVSNQKISARPGRFGRRYVTTDGEAATTEIKVIERFEDSTLVEAMPRTGRTHQIRVHLADLGHPICGDIVYCQDESNLQPTEHTLSTDAEPMCLHSWRLSFAHPITNEIVSFEAEPPSWHRQLLLTHQD